MKTKRFILTFVTGIVTFICAIILANIPMASDGVGTLPEDDITTTVTTPATTTSSVTETTTTTTVTETTTKKTTTNTTTKKTTTTSVSTTTTTTETEAYIEKVVEEEVLDPCLASETWCVKGQDVTYYFYKNSMRVHRNTCIYADPNIMEQVEDYIDYARPCEVCNPDIRIGSIYEPPVTTAPTVETNYVQITYGGDVLTASKGRNCFNGHDETFYNLDMSRVIQNAINSGYDYGYWVRDDGVKMFGSYVIVAADLNLHPRFSLVETSLGTGIVLDTGEFTTWNSTAIDIATTWTIW